MAQQTKTARSRSDSRPSSSKRGASQNGRPPRDGRLTDIAAKAKVPALAAGAGLAGLAGGVALARRTSRARILGIQMPSGTAAHAVSRNLANAAQSVGDFGEGMGSLAAEIRRVREGVADAGDGHRSPIEVVLQSLTRRR
jgi:hypothetical protein